MREDTTNKRIMWRVNRATLMLKNARYNTNPQNFRTKQSLVQKNRQFSNEKEKALPKPKEPQTQEKSSNWIWITSLTAAVIPPAFLKYQLETNETFRRDFIDNYPTIAQTLGKNKKKSLGIDYCLLML